MSVWYICSTPVSSAVGFMQKNNSTISCKQQDNLQEIEEDQNAVWPKEVRSVRILISLSINLVIKCWSP